MPIPSHETRTFSLVPHPAVDGRPVRGIEGRVVRTPGGLQISYILQGDVGSLHVPEQRTPCFADELWRHTCFEMFVMRPDEAAYHEFNFSPSGQWAVYGFAGYRERMPLDPGMMTDPRITVRQSADRLELDASIDLNTLAPHLADAQLLLGISAVVEIREGSLAYWALNHPGIKPDFHHSDAFVLELHEIRN